MSPRVLFTAALFSVLLAAAPAFAEEPRSAVLVVRQRQDIPERAADPITRPPSVTLPAVAPGAGLWLTREVNFATVVVGSPEVNPESSGRCRAGSTGRYAQDCEGFRVAARALERLHYLTLGASAAASAVGIMTAVYGLGSLMIREPHTGVRVGPIVSFTTGGLQFKGNF